MSAAVRFLSCEPLLEEIDLKGWGQIAARIDPAKMPDSWDHFEWPEWVPNQQREHIANFWGKPCGRSPKHWAEDHHSQWAPETGSIVGVKEISKSGIGWVCKASDPEAEIVGKFVHAWNNMGRVITDDGTTHVVSFSRGPGYLFRYLQPDGEYRHRLHWVIAGLESGPNSRRSRIEPVRSLVRQCASSGVPCFVKQLGARPAMSFYEDSTFREWALDRGRVMQPAPRGFVDWDHALFGQPHPRAEVWFRFKDSKGGDPAEWPEDLRVQEWPGGVV